MRPQKLNFTGVILSGTTDDGAADRGAALPGDHAKWVRIPRGAATVSGECCFHAAQPVHWPPLRTSRAWEGAEAARRSASQDTWRRAVLFSRRETRRKGAPCIRLSFVCSRHRSRPAFADRCSAGPLAGPVTGQVVDPDGRGVPGAAVVLTDGTTVVARDADDCDGTVHAQRRPTAAVRGPRSRSTGSAPSRWR